MCFTNKLWLYTICGYIIAFVFDEAAVYFLKSSLIRSQTLMNPASQHHLSSDDDLLILSNQNVQKPKDVPLNIT